MIYRQSNFNNAMKDSYHDVVNLVMEKNITFLDVEIEVLASAMRMWEPGSREVEFA